MKISRAGENIMLAIEIGDDWGNQGAISEFVEPGSALDYADVLRHHAELALDAHIKQCSAWISRPVRHCSRCESFEILHPDRKRAELER